MESGSPAVLLFSAWVPFPVKSCAFSAHVSPWTIHLWALDKSPLSGPGRGLLPATASTSGRQASRDPGRQLWRSTTNWWCFQGPGALALPALDWDEVKKPGSRDVHKPWLCYLCTLTLHPQVWEAGSQAPPCLTWSPGQFMGSQRVGHNWATELNWTELNLCNIQR